MLRMWKAYKRNGKYTVISLFAGCGGSSLGYKMAGYKELLSIDFNKNAIETFKLNFPEIPIWQRDITKTKGQEILDFCKIKKGDLDVLDGSPPCQGFSIAGKRKVMDSRNDLVNEYIRLVSEIDPKVFIMENVSGMVKGKMKGLFIEYVKKMKELNYNVKVKLLNAKYYNVPQSRQRLIFIGIRKDLNKEVVFPIPNRNIIPLREIIPNIIACKSMDINPWIGGNRPSCMINASSPAIIKTKTLTGDNPKNNKAYRSAKQRNEWHKIAPTISKRNNRHGLHPSEDRYFSIEELKRIQTFPDDFIFKINPNKTVELIGNSVPPLFMKAISETIRKEILEKI